MSQNEKMLLYKRLPMTSIIWLCCQIRYSKKTLLVHILVVDCRESFVLLEGPNMNKRDTMKQYTKISKGCHQPYEEAMSRMYHDEGYTRASRHTTCTRWLLADLLALH